MAQGEGRRREGNLESQEIKSLDPMKVGPYVKLVENFYHSYREISVFDLNGISILEKGKTSFEKEEWFRGAVEKGLFVSKAAPGSPSLQPTITISTVIKGGTGSPVGVLRELVDLAYVSELISEARLGKTGELYLVDHKGKFVLHGGLDELSSKNIWKVPYFESPQSKLGYTGTYRDYRGNGS